MKLLWVEEDGCILFWCVGMIRLFCRRRCYRKFAWIHLESVHLAANWPYFQLSTFANRSHSFDIAPIWLYQRYCTIWRIKDDDCVVNCRGEAEMMVSGWQCSPDNVITNCQPCNKSFWNQRTSVRLTLSIKVVLVLRCFLIWCLLWYLDMFEGCWTGPFFYGLDTFWKTKGGF